MAYTKDPAQPAWPCAKEQALSFITYLMRKVALQVSSHPKGKQDDPPVAEPTPLEKPSAIYVTEPEKKDSVEVIDDSTETMSATTQDHPECSSCAASPNKTNQRPCTACGELKHGTDLARAPCEHEYCSGCLELLFQTAMSDERLFPPRCCRQVIPVDANCSRLSGNLVQRFEQKSIELSTRDRTYCHHPTCSIFIPPSNIKDGIAQCPECAIQTCATCKGAIHQGDCPADEALQAVLQVAQQEGWQRCPKCSTMIEHKTGCFHITCTCRAEFCYLCRAPWKTCSCVEREERRLYERAEQIHDQHHNPGNGDVDIGGVNHPPVSPGNKQHDIQNITEQSQQNHECDHDYWRNTKGGYECEVCHQTTLEFIYECGECGITVCRQCKNDRL
ncbi:hypothetical protein F4859DRAFT_484383 [Xylaria cf. heliscus]|nr:hypothetical protein F4859DRAFT_484383 [Xylaria cf. heliscus]